MYSQLCRFPTALVIVGIASSVAVGQVSSDGSLGTQIERSNNQYVITGGELVGDKLFHSFADFSLPTGNVALFEHYAHVSTIIGRVTGGKVSYIDGVIATPSNSSASLFLLNPKGIIFGPHAQLNIGGSFLASTAESLVFSDGTEFSTNIASKPSLLTVSVPIGLQFGSQPGAIINRSQYTRVIGVDPTTGKERTQVIGLELKPNQTLALVGGDVTLEGGTLTVRGGRIELGSVGDNSWVTLTPISTGWQLDYKNVNNFQNIQLLQGSSINAKGPGGTVEVQAKQLTLLETSEILVGPLDAQDGGNLVINATESVEIIGFPNRFQFTGLFNQVDEQVTGNSGSLIINTRFLKLDNGGAIDATTASQGQGGQIFINAQESIEITGVNAVNPSILSTNTDGTGNGGEINITAQRLSISNGGEILAVALSQGNGGTINIDASQLVEVKGTGFITSRNLEISSFISTTSGFRDLNVPAQGNGGNLRINTNRLVVSDGGEINVGSFQGGEAGNLTINAGSILLNNGKLLAASTSGGGGNIFINASGLLVLRNNSLISATAGTEGTGGDGGNIFINAQFILAVPGEDSNIEANAFTGTGGNVNITTNALLGIQFREDSTDLSDITVSSEFGNSGVFSFNRPDVDPQSGLVTLPSEVVDAENLIVQTCGAGGAYTRGEFVIVGRGGFSPDPYDNLELNIGLPDLGDSPPSDHSSVSSTETTVRSSPPTEPVIEAQGWVLNREGKIVLTAQAKNTNTGDYKNNPAICNPLPDISQAQ